MSFACTAETAWGEKDESDVIRQAQTFHIMFRTERDAARAKARLADVRDEDLLAAFRQLARTESVDPGSAPVGGDLGIVQEGVMVRSFEKALFELPPRTVSKPVKSEFGWHLIYAIDFKETSVRQICTSSLADATAIAQGLERETLMQSDTLVQTADFAQRIAGIIGPDWGQPLKDWNGDLAFVQMPPAAEPAALRTALVHVEYTKAVLSTGPLGCRRSARQVYEIDCAARLAGPAARTEYEDRGATGRVLLRTSPSADDRKKYASRTGFHGQLLERACTQ